MTASAIAAADKVDALNSQIDLTSTALAGQAAAAGRSTAALNDLTGAALRAAAAQDGLAARTAASGAAAGLAYYGWTRLLGPVKLFGGAATIGGVHLLVDGIAEVAAVVIPATIALAAFSVAAASSVNDIINKETALFTITTALGTAFPGLSNGLQHFTDSVRPQVWVLFGEALDTINSHTGLFQKLATGAGQVLDNLGARAEMALGGNGLGGLISHGVSDLQLLGDIGGNVLGILGNLLKSMPGYAELLFRGLLDVTGALEAITGSGVVQGLLKIGLYLHGGFLYAGLAATALLAPMKSLGVTFGLLTRPVTTVRGLLSGLGAAFASAGRWVAGYGTALVGLAAEEGIVAAASLAMSDLLDAVSAVNPFVWVAVGVGALVGLVVWLGNTKTASQQALSSIDDLASKATSLTGVTQALTQGLQQTNAQLAQTPKYITVTTMGMHGLVSTVTELNPLWQGLTGNSRALSDQIATQTSRVDQLNKITGSAANTQQDLQAIGVNGLDIYKLTAGAFATLVTEVKAYSDASVQLAGYTAGPAAAAQNALTNLWLNEQLPAIQKITQAEDNLLNVITGGQAAFNDFQQSIQGTTATFVSPSGLADAAKLAKDNLTGINQQSLAYSNTLYTQSIPALQKLTDSLQQQSISTADLTKVTATGAGQILAYAGNNTEAKSVIVDLINNALGPGTVTLKSLNQWVGMNSTSLSNMNGIVAKSTIAAGQLTGALSSTLNSMEAVATFQAHGGQQAWNIFSADLTTGRTKNAAFRQSTQDVMAQLYLQSNQSLPAAHRAFDNYIVNDLGGTKKAADALWKQDLPGLQGEISSLHGKMIQLTMNGVGTYSITQIMGAIDPGSAGAGVGTVLKAAGGYIRGPGGPTSDRVPALLSNGEYVVKAAAVAKYGSHMMDAINTSRFAAGGLVETGNLGVLSGQYAADSYGRFQNTVASSLASAMVSAAKQALSVTGISGDVASYANVVRTALGMLGQPLTDVSVVLRQMTTESGGNVNAVNRSDSNWAAGTPSVGLMQVIGPTFRRWAGPFLNTGPFEYGVSTNPLANVYAGLDYAIHTYPNWTSVLGQGHGYASGGIIGEPVAGIGLRSGSRYSFGENGPETVVPGVGGHGLTVNFPNMIVRDEADITLINQKLSAAVRMASLGGGFR